MQKTSQDGRGANPVYGTGAEGPISFQIPSEDAPIFVTVNDKLRGVPVLKTAIEFDQIRIQNIPLNEEFYLPLDASPAQPRLVLQLAYDENLEHRYRMEAETWDAQVRQDVGMLR